MTSEPLTHKSALAWLAGAVVALVTAALVFGNSIIGAARAEGAKVEDRLEKRLIRIEDKVDRVLEQRGGP